MTDDHRLLYLQKKAALGDDLTIWQEQLEEALMDMDETYIAVCRKNIDALSDEWEQLEQLEREFAGPANRVRVVTRVKS